ncbi:MAG: RNase A-like domain-containing protein [Candidatus Thiodiazotropha lotti]
MAGKDRQLPLSMNLDYEVGRKVLNGSTTVQVSTDTVLLLRRDPLMPNRYRIPTAYPE